jgi:transposase InsO family protein
MVFMLRDQRESLINFLLPNDDAFQRLYDEMVGRLQLH